MATRERMLGRFLCFCFLAACSLTLVWIAGSTEVYVGGFGEPNTIPAGFSAASPGDTIIVRDGTYSMQNWTWAAADSAILLISLNGADNCTINAGGSAYRHIAVDVGVQGARIGTAGAGFTFTGGHPASSDASGGSIFVGPGTDFSVEACVFDGNYTGANGGGGAIFVASGGSWNGSIISCQFTGNHAGHANPQGTGVGVYGGGALCAFSGSGTCNILQCEFTENYITWQSGEADYFGGAMCAQAESESTSIAACIFEGNYIASAPSTDSGNSSMGGALMLHDSFNGRIVDCSFMGNTATEGGAIGAWKQGTSMPSEFRSNLFEGNTASLRGGALCTDHGTFPISDCLFNGNSAGKFGGALYLWHTGHELTNSLFVGNEADSAGGAIWRDGTGAAQDEWNNLTFACNKADSGAAIAAGLTNLLSLSTTIETSIFAFNDGPAFSQMTTGNITVTFDCCDSYGNVGGSGNGEPAAGDACFSEDPAFCRADADSGLFTLWNHSPCASGNHPDEEECGLIGAEGLACWLFADCEATWLDEASPAMSHAGLDTFRVGMFPDSAIGLVHFPSISDEIPDTTAIVDALLTATAQGVTGVPAVNVKACLRPAAIGQATYYVYRAGAAWSYEGGADEGVDFGATTLGTATGFSMYATDTLASGEVLTTWVEDVLDGEEYGILFIRPTSSATSGVVFRGCEEDSGPELRVYSPGGR